MADLSAAPPIGRGRNPIHMYLQWNSRSRWRPSGRGNFQGTLQRTDPDCHICSPFCLLPLIGIRYRDDSIAPIVPLMVDGPQSSHEHSGSQALPSAYPQGAPKRLRSIGNLFAATWSIIRARGLAIVATALIVWLSFAVVAAVLVNTFIDVAAFGEIFSILTSSLSPESLSEIEKINEQWEALISGEWLLHGWSGLAVLGLVLLFLYLLAVVIASISVTDQSYSWLVLGRRANLFSTLGKGLKRAVPGAAILGAYYLAIFVVVVGGMTAGGFAGYFVVAAVTGGDSGIAEVAAVAAGAVLGLVGGIAVSLWLYTVWAVSPYAVALSSHPWSSLGQSRKLTKGSRLDVFIRVLIVTIIVGITLSIIAAPFDFLIGLVPLTAGGLGPLLLVLYLRSVISALSPLVTTASLMSMYVDLGGQTPKDQEYSSPRP